MAGYPTTKVFWANLRSVTVYGVQENPHWMRGVGQSPVCKRVAGQEIAELVMDGGDRYGDYPVQGEPRHDGHKSDDKDRPTLSHSQPCRPAFDSAEPAISQPGREPRRDDKHQQNQPVHME